MKIQIDGTNTLNKGAELMLYAILDKIEVKYPNATVIFNSGSAFTNTINTNLNFKGRTLLKLWKYPKAILSRLGLYHNFKIFSVYNPSNADIILDAGGFQFSDQWNRSDDYLDRLESYYKSMKAKGTKIILLPQAFGPFETKAGLRCASILNKYIDLLIARESVSYQYLIKAGVDKDKIWLYPDFTVTAIGKVGDKYSFTKNLVCIIPNQKMLTHSNITEKAYISLISNIINEVRKHGKEAFLLNHEGKNDLNICKKISSQFNNEVSIVSDVNAIEIKGVIGQSYMVISSRFHGVSSALNQAIPCLSTSWSHKYELLFKDFEVTDTILDIKDPLETTLNKVKFLLDDNNNKKVRSHLIAKRNDLKIEINKMWDEIWSYLQIH